MTFAMVLKVNIFCNSITRKCFSEAAIEEPSLTNAHSSYKTKLKVEAGHRRML